MCSLLDRIFFNLVTVVYNNCLIFAYSGPTSLSLVELLLMSTVSTQYPVQNGSWTGRRIIVGLQK